MNCTKGKPGWRLFRPFFGVCLLLVWNLTGFAAGLGEIKVESRLNQVFFARIDVLLSAGEVPGNWAVGMADMDRYKSMGLIYPRDAGQIRVTLLQLANGKTEILVEGQRPVTELILDIVLVLDDGRSIHVRHYPVLIDFPQLAEPVQAVVERPVVVRPVPARPQAERQQAQYQAGEAIYGPVQPGENLWLIAKNVRGDVGINLNDLMAAIFQLNPEAFMGNDMARLKVGVPLVLPDLGMDYQSDITPGPLSPEQQVFRPGIRPTEEDRSVDIATVVRSSPEPSARLELQGRPDAVSVADSLDRWLESDTVGTAANISEIRRDLSYAAAEIETYLNENEILKTRIDELELRLKKLQTLLSLQTKSIATGQAASDPQQKNAEFDESEDSTVEHSSANRPDPGWTRYALFALLLLVIFVVYVVVRNIREDRARRAKTADLVNRLKGASASTRLPDDL